MIGPILVSPFRNSERVTPTLAATHLDERQLGALHRCRHRRHAILATAKKLEVEHYFIEQDRIQGSAIESLRPSYTYLRKVLA